MTRAVPEDIISFLLHTSDRDSSGIGYVDPGLILLRAQSVLAIASSWYTIVYLITYAEQNNAPRISRSEK